MNYYDEDVRQRFERNRPASRFVRSTLPAPMDVVCICGMRYGQHRVGDYACQNPAWRPGNGKPQWLTAKFKRAA